jgi:hypothetical protein
MMLKIAYVLLLSGSIRAACPQQPSPPQTSDQSGVAQVLQLPPAEPQATITATSDEREGLIHLDVAGRDKQGTSFEKLKSADLTLLQDGTATRILSLHRSNPNDEEERLTEVCLILDEVDLSPTQFALVKNEEIKFLGGKWREIGAACFGSLDQSGRRLHITVPHNRWIHPC